MAKVKHVPAGYHTVTPALTQKDAAAAIELYAKAFGAEEVARMKGPDGRVVHAEIRIGDSIIMMGEEMLQMAPNARAPENIGGATTGALMIYTEDCDALVKRAEAAGCKVTMTPADMFWGDRFAQVTDPFGHRWSIGTHIEDVSPEDMKRREKEWLDSMSAEKKP